MPMQMLKKLYTNLVKKWIKKNGCPCSDVEFDRKLPPEFIITKHAEKRLLERMKISEYKLKKIIKKAWYSKETSDKLSRVEYRNRHNPKYKYCIYRSFCGFVFVFKTRLSKELGRPQKLLITIFDHKQLK